MKFVVNADGVAAAILSPASRYSLFGAGPLGLALDPWGRKVDTICLSATLARRPVRQYRTIGQEPRERRRLSSGRFRSSVSTPGLDHSPGGGAIIGLGARTVLQEKPTDAAAGVEESSNDEVPDLFPW